MAVDKLHVAQSPRNESSADKQDGQSQSHQQDGPQDSPSRRDQERREMLQRMWRRLANGSDPLDLVA